MAQTDRRTLVALYNATGGARWKDKRNWNTRRALSQWYGVEVNTQGRVVELVLRSNKLQGPIPPELGNLVALQRLHLAFNELSGPIPKELGGLSELKELWLYHNELNGHIPKELGDLGSLKSLNLGDNRLDGRIPPELGNLEALRVLSLMGNQLSGPIPEALGNLSKLEELWLTDNQLTGFPAMAAAAFLKRKRIHTYIAHDNPWKDPPSSVVHQGLDAIVRYHSDIERSGSGKSWMLKVVVIGAVGAGKSSLVKSLIANRPQTVPPDDRTRGVDVHIEEPCQPDKSKQIQFVFWDFAGHGDYFSTHSLFLSSGALLLLVVNLARFVKDPPSRSESIHMWLDKAVCTIPGAVVQIVATHIDEPSVIHQEEDAVQGLRKAVREYWTAKSEERRLALDQFGRKGEIPPALRIVDKILSISSKEGTNLAKLGEELAELAADGTTARLADFSKADMGGRPKAAGKLFPEVGKTVPHVWTRACAMMNALRDGSDPHQAARLDKSLAKLNQPILCISLKDAEAKWKEVVNASRTISREVGRGKATVVLQDAIRLKQHEGMFLREHGLLHLDPRWINILLRAILDHRHKGRDPGALEDLKHYCKSSEHFFELSNTHQTFHNSGTLSLSYLFFLWRDVREIHENNVFKSMVQTMRTHGVLFSKSAGFVDAGSDDCRDEGWFKRILGSWYTFPTKSRYSYTIKSSTEFFVPVLLGPHPAEEELEEFSRHCHQHKWRLERVYRIYRSYVPPGLIGLIAARLLCSDKVQIRFAWRRGMSFRIGGGEGILVLRPSPEIDEQAEIEIDVAGPELSDQADNNLIAVGMIVKNVLKENFPGLLFDLKGGKVPRLVQGEDALVAEIKGLREDVGDIDERLGHIDENLARVQRGIRDCLKRLTYLQGLEYPNLVVIREHTPGISTEGGRRKPRVLSKNWWRLFAGGIRSMAMTDMRLVFVCPHDTSVVPCGPNGEGFSLGRTREWVKKLLPVAQVTVVILRATVKASVGLDLDGVSTYLNLLKTGIGEELADRYALDEEALGRVIAGGNVGDGDAEKIQTLSKAGYNALEEFMKKQEQKEYPSGFIDFRKEMQQVDDGNDGTLWVRNENVTDWLASIERGRDSFPTKV